MANGVKQGGVISPIFFSLYIGPLLEYLRRSGYGCHMKGVYIGVISYADDITILSPSIGGLNEMLKICHIFAEKNSILFNSKKTVCIKFGGNVVRNKEAYLNSHPLLWMDKIRHLGNIIDKDCNKSLRKMISICEQYAKTHSITFNPNKSKLLCYNAD